MSLEDDLYSFPSKPFAHSISDDNDDGDGDVSDGRQDLFNSGRGKKRKIRKPSKYKPQKKTISPILVDSSDDDDQNDFHSGGKKAQLINLDSDEEEVTISSKAKEKADSMLQQRLSSIQPKSSNSLVMNLVMTSENEVQKLSAMLQRMREKQDRPIVQDITDEPTVKPATYSSVLPVVRRASERCPQNDSLAQLTEPTPSSSQSTTTPTPPANLIKLNTRLNGKHRGNWKMSKTDNFLKLKEAFRTKYGLESIISLSDIKLASCDGPLADTDNPEDADLEEDDLIDVKINKLTEEQIAEAIVHFENSAKKKSNFTRASTAPIPQTSSIQVQAQPTSSLPQTRSTSSAVLPSSTSLPPPPPPSTTSSSSSSSSSSLSTSSSTTSVSVTKVNVLIPETLSTSKKDLYISVKVTANQTLQDICRGIGPHIVSETVWFSLYDESAPERQPQELSLSMPIGDLPSQSSGELTILVHPESSKSIELTVICKNNRGVVEQSIKLIVKPTQTCRKMIERISTHVNVPQTSCTFTFQRKKLKITDTFQSLGIVEGSEIVMTRK